MNNTNAPEDRKTIGVFPPPRVMKGWKSVSAGWYGSLDRKKVPKIVVTDGGGGGGGGDVAGGGAGVLDGNKTNAQESSGIKINDNDGLNHKQVDLDKIFKPATDSGEVTPSKNRKMYASSSFYGPDHPTVEQQFELARRISSSLSDISNQQSKGQSMYVNRKKRSVKWVHEGEGKGPIPSNFPLGLHQQSYESTEQSSESKQILKLVMDPRGQVQDLQTLRKLGENIEPCLSPEICFDLVRDLNAAKGKGAALFAKRRKRSENWVIDEHNVKSISPSLSEPANINHGGSNITIHPQSTGRAENIQKMNEIQQRFTQPRLRLIKSPWEAALETGSVESAFQEMAPVFPPRGYIVAPTSGALEALKEGGRTSRATACSTPSRTATPKSCQDVYMPKVPRGWNTHVNRQQPATYESYEASSGNEQSKNVQLPSYKDYLSLGNYNTAPRGWKQGGTEFYRPVTFNKQPKPEDNCRKSFTDF